MATERKAGEIDPDEPAHIEINGATVEETGQEIELTSQQEKAIEERIAEYLDEQLDIERERYAWDGER